MALLPVAWLFRLILHVIFQKSLRACGGGLINSSRWMIPELAPKCLWSMPSVTVQRAWWITMQAQVQWMEAWRLSLRWLSRLAFGPAWLMELLMAMALRGLQFGSA